MSKCSNGYRSIYPYVKPAYQKVEETTSFPLSTFLYHFKPLESTPNSTPFPSLPPTSSPLSSTLTLHLPLPSPHMPESISRRRSPIQVGKILKHHRPKCPRIDITSPLTKAITYPEKTNCRISCITIRKGDLPEDFAGGERR